MRELLFRGQTRQFGETMAFFDNAIPLSNRQPFLPQFKENMLFLESMLSRLKA